MKLAERTQHKTAPIDFSAWAEEHLSYEAWMFVTARERLADNIENLFCRNALVEVAVLHLRNLLDFFLRPPGKDDVAARHFDPKWPFEEIEGSFLHKSRVRANKQLAHLTQQRQSGTPTSKNWDFRHLSAELRPIVLQFIDRAELPIEVQNALRRI